MLLEEPEDDGERDGDEDDEADELDDIVPEDVGVREPDEVELPEPELEGLKDSVADEELEAVTVEEELELPDAADEVLALSD